MPNSLAFPPVECCLSAQAELAALVEGCAVTDRSHDRGCHQRADTGYLSEPLAGRVGRGDLFYLFVHANDLLFEILPLAPEKADQVAHAWRQVRLSVLEDRASLP
jgi:hypothetical protein